jgi:hypothetical protein
MVSAEAKHEIAALVDLEKWAKAERVNFISSCGFLLRGIILFFGGSTFFPFALLFVV